MTMARLHPRDRYDAILGVALALSESVGYAHITRAEVAAAAGVSPALVSWYLGTVPQMRAAVMHAAVKNARSLSVIAQGITARDPVALRAPLWLRAQALSTLA